MTNSNYPARQQGTTISKKLYYRDFDHVRSVVRQLQEQGVFRHAAPADVDVKGSFVLITYDDPTVVSSRGSAPSSNIVPIARPQKLALPQRPTPVTKPVHKRWWFIPSIVLVTLTLLCGAGYWGVQQLKQVSAPNIGAGVVGFLFVVVLVVAIVKKIGGGGGGNGHGGGYGFHYGPCD
jgi:hypothetical protein